MNRIGSRIIRFRMRSKTGVDLFFPGELVLYGSAYCGTGSDLSGLLDKPGDEKLPQFRLEAAAFPDPSGQPRVRVTVWQCYVEEGRYQEGRCLDLGLVQNPVKVAADGLAALLQLVWLIGPDQLEADGTDHEELRQKIKAAGIELQF